MATSKVDIHVLILGNIRSHHEGHLDGDIRDLVWLGGELATN